MSNSNPKRDPRGIRTGGQYVAENRREMRPQDIDLMHVGAAAGHTRRTDRGKTARDDLYRHFDQGRHDASLRRAIDDAPWTVVVDAAQRMREGQPVGITEIAPRWRAERHNAPLPGRAAPARRYPSSEYAEMRTRLEMNRELALNHPNPHVAARENARILAVARAYDSLPSDAHRNVAQAVYGETLTADQADMVADLPQQRVEQLEKTNNDMHARPTMSMSEHRGNMAAQIERDAVRPSDVVEPSRAARRAGTGTALPQQSLMQRFFGRR